MSRIPQKTIKIIQKLSEGRHLQATADDGGRIKREEKGCVLNISGGDLIGHLAREEEEGVNNGVNGLSQ